MVNHRVSQHKKEAKQGAILGFKIGIAVVALILFVTLALMFLFDIKIERQIEGTPLPVEPVATQTK